MNKKQRRELKRQQKEVQKQEAEKRAERRRFIRRIGLWAGVLLGLIVIVFGLIIITDPDLLGVSWLSDRDSVGEWTRGNSAARISLVEYSDFQCPSCARYHKFAEKLIEEEGEKFEYTFRHFPLEGHRNAELAAITAEAAGRQGKFWEMHDRLFKYQKEWGTLEPQTAEELFVDYAAFLNLDKEEFKRDLRSQAILEKVRNDYRSGIRSGVKGTPTYFLNGKRITKLPRSYKDFKFRILQYESNPS